MGDEDECLDVGAPEAHTDGPTTFGVQPRHRAKAREEFVRWDSANELDVLLCERPHDGWIQFSKRYCIVLQRSTNM